ncbi:MAG: hypothetical protein A2381_19140 [Bdellovibrionales bacterium RIFOXYB1_FULL_37_110]|nr:MAG: hypothetical protein A2181_09410 [Bdellovibrionales bacterium RIFOXYA1_FULL_38_20]OFZ49493.1 MAG: hypothetical protein A2417_04290 [Bdellovibrionales bacterium RIFOXYC1_FULL_37_79]OFZ58647.1 MAG: hypothetical protein A2381_19140 [Bdellovibrionales bacterium RIFOXYB1_FULL_37_110]OFZ63388.1 MAG: hypothetical protein A2577_17400 [Bdellovibrionales bacterium RIFOXYD1_FULL_36_51]
MQNKKWMFLILMLFTVMPGYGEILVKEYDFGDPVILDFRFEIEGLQQTADPGKPILPFKQARILLPSHGEFAHIEVVRDESRRMVPPGQLEISSGLIGQGSGTLIPVADLDLDVPYLQHELDYKIQKYKGARILLVNMYPVYIDQHKDFYFSPRLKVVVHFDVSEIKNSASMHARDFEDVRAFIDDTDFLTTYQVEKNLTQKSYDYLIVTTNAFENSKSLKKLTTFLLQERKLTSKVININKELPRLEGVDNAQKLRNLIKSEYQNYAPRFLLLVGDSDGASPLMPVRKLFASVRGYIGGNWKIYNEYIPSDFYYGCLDGDFNYDGDNRWGEPGDGDQGADVDFLCELTVGRFPVDSETQLDILIEKTKAAYNLENRQKKVLMLGELLFKEMDLWGGDYMNQLLGTVDDHGFVSRGYDSTWDVFKLYEKEKDWSGKDAINLIEKENPLMVNHLGHSNETMNMKIASFTYRGMNNIDPYFYYSQGCLAANFTKNDSIIEKMIYTKGGPFAVIANSTYGLGPEDPEFGSVKYPGTSQILHRYFMDRVLNDQYLFFGKAHQGSKEDILRYIAFQEARWVIWGANYFGDPSIAP